MCIDLERGRERGMVGGEGAEDGGGGRMIAGRGKKVIWLKAPKDGAGALHLKMSN